MKVAKIIITQQPIPSSSNGSWTQRLEHFLISKYNNVDYIICGKTEGSIDTASVVLQTGENKNALLKKMALNYRYQSFSNQLVYLSRKYDHLIVMVIDNLKLKATLSDCISKNNLNKRLTFLFYNCGFSYYLNQREHEQFSRDLNEIVFLTNSAYHFNMNYYNQFAPEVTILNNPILKTKFYKASPKEKEDLLEVHKLSNKKVYLWLSHDRPKKGLSIILNAWKNWSKDKNDVVLLIGGASRQETIENVKFLGIIPREEVDTYYKLADVYLFPTLWKEGFGLSLSQAICSGCFCIAAENGGVSEFFTEEDGILESEPNIVSHWENHFETAYNAINSGWSNETAGHQILSMDSWSREFAQVFRKWENRLKV